MQSIDDPVRPWWQRPPGLPMTLTAIALVLVLSWAISLPGGDFMVLLMAFWPTAAFALVPSMVHEVRKYVVCLEGE